MQCALHPEAQSDLEMQNGQQALERPKRCRTAVTGIRCPGFRIPRTFPDSSVSMCRFLSSEYRWPAPCREQPEEFTLTARRPPFASPGRELHTA